VRAREVLRFFFDTTMDDRVLRILGELDIGRHSEYFKDHHIDYYTLLTFEPSDLLLPIGPRAKLMAYIRQIRGMHGCCLGEPSSLYLMPSNSSYEPNHFLPYVSLLLLTHSAQPEPWRGLPTSEHAANFGRTGPLFPSLKVRLPADVRRNIGSFIPTETSQALPPASLINFNDDLAVDAWIFEGTYLGCNGVGVLANHFVGSMRELVLTGNDIGFNGTSALARALMDNTTLETLHIQDNIIADYGAEELARMLNRNHTLRTLKLYGNGIGPKGCEALALALKCNTTLQTMRLFSNRVTNQAAMQFAVALRRNRTVQILSLSTAGINPMGAAMIAGALRHNSTLRELHLGNVAPAGTVRRPDTRYDNTVGHEGAMAFAGALRCNRSLQCLKLPESMVGKDGRKAIEEALKENSILTSSIASICSDQSDPIYPDYGDLEERDYGDPDWGDSLDYGDGDW